MQDEPAARNAPVARFDDPLREIEARVSSQGFERAPGFLAARAQGAKKSLQAFFGPKIKELEERAAARGKRKKNRLLHRAQGREGRRVRSGVCMRRRRTESRRTSGWMTGCDPVSASEHDGCMILPGKR